MQGSVPVYLSADTAGKLEKLALIGGDVSTVIERLLSHWQNTATSPTDRQLSSNHQSQAMWKTPYGDLLPIGQELVATYKGKKFSATIEPTGLRVLGTLFPNPSAAGRAVKHSLNVVGKAANTDGRIFWKLRDPSTGRNVSIANLHPGDPVDTARLLAELRGRSTASAV